MAEGWIPAKFKCWPEGRDLDVLLRGLPEAGVEDTFCWTTTSGFVEAARLAKSVSAPCPRCGSFVGIEPVSFEE